MPRDAGVIRRHRALLEARRAPGADQRALGPREHGAYAESRVRENPVLGPIEQLISIPAYTAAKAAGFLGGRSPPSVDELAEGYRGVGRGVSKNIGDLLAFASGSPSPVARPTLEPSVSSSMSDAELAAFLARNRKRKPRPMQRERTIVDLAGVAP